jgi:disulfide bond formation protein DsbB
MLEPCRLCWYQRVCLFPLALILAIGIYRNDKGVLYYVLPLCICGGVVAFYQALGTHYPSLAICSKECAKSIFSLPLLDWMTFPDLSFFGFAVMGAFLFVAYKNLPKGAEH